MGKNFDMGKEKIIEKGVLIESWFNQDSEDITMENRIQEVKK